MKSRPPENFDGCLTLADHSPKCVVHTIENIFHPLIHFALTVSRWIGIRYDPGYHGNQWYCANQGKPYMHCIWLHEGTKLKEQLKHLTSQLKVQWAHSGHLVHQQWGPVHELHVIYSRRCSYTVAR